MDIDLIRKLASLEEGRRYLEGPQEDSLDFIHQSKLVTAADWGLMKIAMRLPGDLIEAYEALGGTYAIAKDA